MSLPKVTVIIPCYNMETYLLDCMDSVLGQTLRQIEAICIDDGSTDSTPRLLDELREKDARVRVVHQENQGVAAARNRGLALAEGEFVAFMDPDDFYPNSGTLELLYTKAVEANVLICGGSFSNYNQKTGRITSCYAGDYAKYSFPQEGYISYSDYQFDFGYHRFLYNRKFLKEHDLVFPPYARFQDPPFFVRAMILAGVFYAVPDVVYRYRVGIQDKPTSWPSAKLHDMMRGHLDDLRLSAEEGLAELHALTLRRFEDDMAYDPVMKSVREGNTQTVVLLNTIQDALDASLLQSAGMLAAGETGYIIRHLRETDPEESAKRNTLTELVKKLIRSLQEQGIGYTFRLIREKFDRS